MSYLIGNIDYLKFKGGMVRIHKRKFNIVLVLFVLIVYTLTAPLSALANSTEEDNTGVNAEAIEVGKVVTDNDEEVPLYEKQDGEEQTGADSDDSTEVDNESSNILIYLKDDDEVEIIEEYDQYTLVEYTQLYESDLEDEENQDELQVWQGYIENKFLEIDNNEDVTENDSDQEEEKESSKDSSEEENNKVESDSEDPSDEESSDDISDEDEESNEDPESESQEQDQEKEATDEETGDKESNEDPESESQEQDREKETTEEETEDDSEEKVDDEQNNEETNNKRSLSSLRASSQDIRGVAKKEKTYIRKEDSTKVEAALIVPQGTILNYKPYREYWYEVFENGKSIGFVHEKHVENTVSKQETIKGVGLKSPTNVRKIASTKSDVVKTYPIGTMFEYKTFSEHWYEVYENGKSIGFVHKKHVKNGTAEKQESLRGVTLKAPTNIRTTPSTKSKVLKKYKKGTVIQYKTFNKYWYEVEVSVNGTKESGFVHKKHVENATVDPKVLRGVTLKSPTNIRALPSTKTSVIAKYSQGSVISYRAFNDYWYEVQMIINGELRYGFVHKKHVENATSNQEKIKGAALKSPTNVRQKASTKSNVVKTYPIGSIIEYKTFSEYWYEVVENGKSIGYIHKKHVYDSSGDKQESLRGAALKSPTNIRMAPSTDAKVSKKLKIGTVFEYRTFSKHWYEVIENGKPIGFVHEKHVENATAKEKSSSGIGLKSPTNIRTLPSTKTDVLATYPKGSVIKYKTFNKHWNVVTVNVNGEHRTGFIHKKHIGDPPSTEIDSTDFNLSLDQAVYIQMKVAPQTDTKYAWVSKEYINKSSKVTASKLNVRVGPGTGHASVGTLSKGTTVNILDEYNGWYAIKYKHNTQWVHAHSKDVRYYLDPRNFMNDEKLMFQFLDLSKPSGATVTVLNGFLSDKGILKSKGQAFIDAGKKHKINDVYLISHAQLETGNGTSKLATGIEVGLNKDNKPTMVSKSNKKNLTNIKTVYNIYGIGAIDECPVKCGSERAYEEGWTTPEKAIIGGAKFIGNDYIKGENSANTVQNTLYKMRWNPEYMNNKKAAGHQYATDIGWASKQVDSMYNLYQKIGSYTLYLDVPVYK